MALSEELHGISKDLQSIPRLVGDAFEQLGKLVQNEAELARAELSQKVGQAATGAAFLGVAAVFVIPTVVVLLIALAEWLTASFDFAPAGAYLISAVVGAVMSGAFGLIGMSYLKADNLKPKVTIRQVERDIQAAKEMAR